MHVEAPQQILLLLIILFPLGGAIINGLLGRYMAKGLVTLVGVGSVAVSFALAVVSFVELYGLSQDAEHAALVYHFYEWFSLKLPGGTVVPINVRFMMDSLSGVMTLVVTGVGGLIHLYSIGYMGEDEGYPRFMSFLNLFMASMLILVLGSSLPVMFVGWEGVGLCSYLLIGFWYENGNYAAAGRKAFVVNRIGDFGVLVGMFILVGVAGSFEFADINAAAAGGEFQPDFPILLFGLAPSLATVACLFLFLGCTGKSAQIPLFVWLPDAMAGPTPVSALIHAATMVTAGVYLCCRLSPLFITSDVAMAIIAVTGTLTALLAASIAVVQREMKKILAYSTVSQLGFMFAAVGVGFFAAGFFHVFTHAFFKACLFLGAGSVMHAVHAHGDADIFKLGGLKKHLPITRWTFLASCLAIAGFPLTSGFFSKDEILLGAAAQIYRADDWLTTSVGWFTLIGLTLAAVMTAFYMFRLYFLTFTGEYRSADQSGDHPYDAHPHESPPSMTIPLVVLGIGALVVGFLGLPHVMPITGTHLHSWWSHWMHASVAGQPVPEEMQIVNLASGLAFGAMAIGISAAWLLYRNKSTDALTDKIPARVYQLAFDKWRVDELYAATIVNPIKRVATVVGHADMTFVDALMTKWPSFKVRETGRIFARLQNGVVQMYGAVMMVGVVVVLAWFWTPHSHIEAAFEGTQVELTTPVGLGYEYRWDANSDGEFETQWERAPGTTFEYAHDDIRGVAVFLGNVRSGVERRIPVSEEWTLLPIEAVVPAELLSPREIGFEVRVDGKDLLFRQSQAPATPSGRKEFRLPMGRDGRLGPARVLVRPLVEATVEVRNAFGNTDRATKEIALPFAVDAPSHASLIQPTHEVVR
ncbi:MAG: NADH-quinone oxidoreductase subunit L [Deltaproteobacteria bacterium]|jgi:NADH-quinone oxidoreductase subunit L|nr:NADH-quinone oxidoreductase subunit L [Deltaproteobacteria bacterium]